MKSRLLERGSRDVKVEVERCVIFCYKMHVDVGQGGAWSRLQAFAERYRLQITSYIERKQNYKVFFFLAHQQGALSLSALIIYINLSEQLPSLDCLHLYLFIYCLASHHIFISLPVAFPIRSSVVPDPIIMHSPQSYNSILCPHQFCPSEYPSSCPSTA